VQKRFATHWVHVVLSASKANVPAAQYTHAPPSDPVAGAAQVQLSTLLAPGALVCSGLGHGAASPVPVHVWLPGHAAHAAPASDVSGAKPGAQRHAAALAASVVAYVLVCAGHLNAVLFTQNSSCPHGTHVALAPAGA
jgi:hypothetical protein